MRRLVLIVIAAASALPRPAAAQSQTRQPRVELGVAFAAAAGAGPEAPVSVEPSVAVNLDRLTAIEAVVQPDLDRAGSTRDQWRVQIRRALVELDGGRVFATAGVAQERRTSRFAFQNQTLTYRSVDWSPSAGIGVELDMTRRLALRADVRWARDFAGAVSLAIPLGLYPDRHAWREAESDRAGGPFADVHFGQRLWITTRFGEVVEGEAASGSPSSLTLLQRGTTVTVSSEDVVRLETTDPLGNGITLGTLIGGVTGSVLGVVLMPLCESDAGCGMELLAAFATIGVGFGALTGALADSLRAGRRTIFARHDADGRRLIVLAPMVSRRGGGVGGTVTW